MAEDIGTIDDKTASLAEQLECQQLAYSPTELSPAGPGPQRYIFPVAPYALGLWHPGDDVHLVCLTDNSSNTFWEYIAEKLDREDLPKHDCIISKPDCQETIWLHYCGIPPHFDLATVEAYGFPKYPASAYVPLVAQQNLARLQDTWYLLDRLGQDLKTFRDDYNTLRRWAEAAGVFSKVCGLLDAESLLWILFNAISVADKSSVNEQTSLTAGLQSFIAHHKIRDVLTPSRRKAYCPPSHVAANSYATLDSEISLLALSSEMLELSTEQYYQMFCNRFKTMALVSAECWAPKQRETFHSQLVNQITHLPERIHDSGVDLQTLRIWPHAFRPSEDEWVYVIGVERLETFGSSPVVPVPTAALREVVEGAHLKLDNTIGSAIISLCSAEEALNLPSKHSTTKTSPAASAPPPPPNTASSRPLSPSSKRFPPASQVLSRLRWDPAHAPFDYEVGYLDRFEGLMWLPLEQWGKETEDEEFIPEHRIRVFRRVVRGGTAVVVWDREGRMCSLGG